jgi:hypothetical protein
MPVTYKVVEQDLADIPIVGGRRLIELPYSGDTITVLDVPVLPGEAPSVLGEQIPIFIHLNGATSDGWPLTAGMVLAMAAAPFQSFWVSVASNQPSAAGVNLLRFAVSQGIAVAAVPQLLVRGEKDRRGAMVGLDNPLPVGMMGWDGARWAKELPVNAVVTVGTTSTAPVDSGLVVNSGGARGVAVVVERPGGLGNGAAVRPVVEIAGFNGTWLALHEVGDILFQDESGVFVFYPGIPGWTGGQVFDSVDLVLPRNFRVRMEHDGDADASYTAFLALLP